MFSDQTRDQYLQRADKVLKKYFREQARTWRDDPRAFIHWMAVVAGRGWVKSTWRLTFRAVEVSLETQGAPLELLEHLKAVARDGYKQRISSLHQKRKINGQPQHRKTLSAEDFQRILDALQNTDIQKTHALRSSQYDQLLGAFMRMNVHLGLRPNEAGDLRLVKIQNDDQQNSHTAWGARIRNSKISENRKSLWTDKESRFLSVSSDLADAVREFIQERDRLLVLVPDWNDLQKALTRRIRDVSTALGIFGVTLYTTRHQFAANAKKGGTGAGEIARRMGHSSTNTARQYYGPSKGGWRPEQMADGVQEARFEPEDATRESSGDTTQPQESENAKIF